MAEKKIKGMTLRISEEDKESIREASQISGIPMAGLIREAALQWSAQIRGEYEGLREACSKK